MQCRSSPHPDDSADVLRRYVERFQPACRLLDDISDEDRARVKRMVKLTLFADGQPASIVTDREGRVLRTFWGSPTISEMRRLVSDSSSPTLRASPVA